MKTAQFVIELVNHNIGYVVEQYDDLLNSRQFVHLKIWNIKWPKGLTQVITDLADESLDKLC